MEMKFTRQLLYLSGLVLFFSSCSLLNQNIMFRTDANYQFSAKNDSNKIEDYKISPNDIIVFNVYTNDGFKLIDLGTTTTNNIINSSSVNGNGVNASGSNSSGITTGGNTNSAPKVGQYLVEGDGTVKLPIIGRKKLSGLTVREAELVLEESFSAFYIKPFVVLGVNNRKVILFPGSPGSARIMPLPYNNTTLLEIIASAGGITVDGKARKIKLIRDVNKKHEVYLMDLSTIKGIDDANMILQANDIIYVEPRQRVSSRFLTEITPVLSILSTILITVVLLRTVK